MDLSTKREKIASYAFFVIPGLCVYLFVMAFPTILSIGISLTSYNGGPIFGNRNIKFTGLRSYSQVFTDRYFFMALKNNMLVVLVSVFGQIPLGFIIAYILSRKIVKGADFFQTAVYLPNVISPIIIGILFRTFFLSRDSLVMDIIRLYNRNAEWSPSRYPMIPVLIIILWMYTGGYVIIFLANLQRIDTAIIESAKIDGANEGQILLHILLPALSGVIVISAILAISGSLKIFELVFIMTQGGPASQTTVLALYMYDKAFKSGVNFSIANAISTIMAAISFAMIGITMILESVFGGRE
jgi:raffinose/stachyose/melibiose transport system permease protein